MQAQVGQITYAINQCKNMHFPCLHFSSLSNNRCNGNFVCTAMRSGFYFFKSSQVHAEDCTNSTRLRGIYLIPKHFLGTISLDIILRKYERVTNLQAYKVGGMYENEIFSYMKYVLGSLGLILIFSLKTPTCF